MASSPRSYLLYFMVRGNFLLRWSSLQDYSYSGTYLLLLLLLAGLLWYISYCFYDFSGTQQSVFMISSITQIAIVMTHCGMVNRGMFPWLNLVHLLLFEWLIVLPYLWLSLTIGSLVYLCKSNQKDISTFWLTVLINNQFFFINEFH